MKAHHGAVDAHPGALGSQSEGMEAHHSETKIFPLGTKKSPILFCILQHFYHAPAKLEAKSSLFF
jgi:hypothetical protein